MEQVDTQHLLLIESDRGYIERFRQWLNGGGEAGCKVSNIERLSNALRHLKQLSQRNEPLPDAIALNLSLPDCAGPAGLERLVMAAPGIPIVAITTRLSERHARDAIRIGAVASLSRESMTEQSLREAVHLAFARRRTSLLNRPLNGRGALTNGRPEPDSVLERLGFPAYLLGADGTILDANKAAARMLGRGRSDLSGTAFRDLVPEAERGRVDEFMAGRAGDGEQRSVESSRLTARGSEIRVLVSTSRLYDPDGEIAGVLVLERPVDQEEEDDQSPPALPETLPMPEWPEDDTRPTVLVVEDNDVSRRMLKRMLDAKYRVVTAPGPNEALTYAAQWKFDVLLLDINLGDRRTGVELLTAIRKAPSYRNVPAVACTAYALPGLSDRLIELGFDAYISKPFVSQTLLDTIESAFNKKPSEPVETVDSESRELELPPMPGSLADVVEMLSDDNGADIERLTSVLETDPVVSAWVLHHINSAFYSLRGNVSSVERAVTLLGFEPICNLVLSKVLAQTFSNFEAEKPSQVYDYLQRSSVATAAFARKLAMHLELPEPELSFTAGLLHQLGRLGLLSMEPERYAGMWFTVDGEKSETPSPPTVGQELLHMGADHAALGVEIARDWQLPKKLAFVIGRQNKPIARAATPEALLALTVTAGSMAARRLYEADRFQAGDAEHLASALKILARQHEVPVAELEDLLVESEQEVRELVGKIVAE